MMEVDVCIIGGGIVGLATAYRLGQSCPKLKLLVLEKEGGVAAHQTGRNSGVLHSGIYYVPGSLKALNCREGKRAMEAFCQENGVPYEICGKVIVAVDESQLPALEMIYQRGVANGVRCELIDRNRLRELEPHAAGIKAIHVRETGIIDFKRVCLSLVDRVIEAGGQIYTATPFRSVRRRGERQIIETDSQEIDARLIVNCAGLQCDRVMRKEGTLPSAQIVPFRGEYYKLNKEQWGLCRNLIYPVPDPKFPFLGVHFTRMIEGGIECGPNAVLAFAREGYRKTDVNLRDLVEILAYPGFRRMARRHWRMGLGEMWRSLNKRAFVQALQKLIPEIDSRDLAPIPAGVRAQAVRPDGGLADDFLIVETDTAIHLNNAPSPAATAALNIGNLLVAKIQKRW